MFPQTVFCLMFDLCQTSPSMVSGKNKILTTRNPKNVSHLESDRSPNMHERAGEVQLNDDPSGDQDEHERSEKISGKEVNFDRLICCSNTQKPKMQKQKNGGKRLRQLRNAGERGKETHALAARTNAMVK
jgi:hypothetical protein